MILVIWSSKLKPAKIWGTIPRPFLQTLRPRPTRFAEFVVVVFCSFGVYIYICARVYMSAGSATRVETVKSDRAVKPWEVWFDYWDVNKDGHLSPEELIPALTAAYEVW